MDDWRETRGLLRKLGRLEKPAVSALTAVVAPFAMGVRHRLGQPGRTRISKLRVVRSIGIGVTDEVLLNRTGGVPRGIGREEGKPGDRVVRNDLR